MKKHTAITALLALAMVLSLTACAPAEEKVAGTYTQYLDSDALTGNTYRSGFVSAMGQMGTLSQTNTLDLNADGTYRLEKHLEVVQESGNKFLDVDYIFTGTFRVEGSRVWLNAAETLDASEDWGMLSDQFDYLETFQHRTGTDETAEHYGDTLIQFFPGAEWKLSGANEDQAITLNTADMTFSYLNLEDIE